MGSMDRGTDEERQRVKTDFSLAIGEMWYGGGRRENNPVLAELQEAEKELKADTEMNFHFEWNIVDVDESHIYVTNKKMAIDTIFPLSTLQHSMLMSIVSMKMEQNIAFFRA